ncbi:tape measure protein [Roseiconus nitratireducens]|nr:tape measure protein [Roseiconus nitratireducens]
MKLAVRSVKRFGDNVDHETHRLSRFRNQVVALGSALAGLRAAQAFGSFLRDSARVAADFESAKVSFGVLLGDAQKASKLLDDLNDFGLATPFNVRELREATRQLLAYGVSAEDVLTTLKSLGDIAAGTQSNLGDVAEIYGRVLTSNRLQGEEINRLQDRGIPILRLLSKQLDRNVADIRKMAAQGEIGIRELQRAFVELTTEGGKFSGQMQELSKTTLGQLSSFEDEVAEFKREIGEGLLPELRNWLGITRELTVWGREMDLGEAVRDISAAFTELAEKTAAVFQWLRSGVVGIELIAVRIVEQIARLSDAVLGTDLRRQVKAFADELRVQFDNIANSGIDLWKGLDPDQSGSSKAFAGLETVTAKANAVADAMAAAAEKSKVKLEDLTKSAKETADDLRNEFATPLDKFRMSVDEINRANLLGGLDRQTAVTAIKERIDGLIESTRMAKRELETVGALTKGSQEEFAARNQRFLGGPDEEREEGLRVRLQNVIDASRLQLGAELQQLRDNINVSLPRSIEQPGLRGAGDAVRQTAINTGRLNDIASLLSRQSEILGAIERAVARPPLVVTEVTA